MNEKEKTEFYIAMCKCCLIAQVMKSCPKCRFKIGLNENMEAGAPILVSLPIRKDLFVLSEQQ
jgi:hypothetical protein